MCHRALSASARVELWPGQLPSDALVVDLPAIYRQQEGAMGRISSISAAVQAALGPTIIEAAGQPCKYCQ